MTDDNDPAHAGDDSRCRMIYDSLSRVIEEVQMIGAEERRIGYEWSFRNEQTGLTYPNARVIRRRYDRIDRLVAVSDVGGSSSSIAAYRYLGVDRVLECALGNDQKYHRHRCQSDSRAAATGSDRKTSCRSINAGRFRWRRSRPSRWRPI